MTKNAAKKRRSSRPKVSKKTKNTFKYKKPDITSSIVREMWDNNLTAEANMAKMGLRQNANSDIRPSAASAAAAAAASKSTPKRGCEVSRLFDVADTADLRVIDRNYGRRPLSDEDQRYAVKLMARYGLDHEAMARDVKINYKQLTLGKLRHMCNTLLALGENQRVVEIPERVLKEACTSVGDKVRRGDDDSVIAMEEDEPPVLAESSRKEETIKKMGKKKKKLMKQQGGREKIAD